MLEKEDKIFTNKKKVSLYLLSIWIIIVIIEIILYKILYSNDTNDINDTNNNNEQSGGFYFQSLSNKQYIMLTPIIIGIILSFLIIWKNSKRNRCFAYALALISPIIPLNRIYTGNFMELSTLIRFIIPIPIFSGLIDIYLYDRGILIPNYEWTESTKDCNLKCCLHIEDFK
jgi:hypothetical protein